MLIRLNGKEKINRPRKIGLALSGGGLHGISHIGVLSHFDKSRYLM